MFFKITVTFVLLSKAIALQVAKNKIQINDKNYHQLMNIVTLLNAQDDYNDLDSVDQKENDLGKETEDVNDLLRLAQRNYDAHLNRKDHDESRIIYISNPDVLEQYLKEFKGKRPGKNLSTSSSSSSSSFSSSSSEEPKYGKLKEVLQNIRRRTIMPIDDEEGFIVMRRQRDDVSRAKSGNIVDYSIEKAPWKEETQRNTKNRNKDLSQAFDTNVHVKNNFGPKKRPVGYQVPYYNRFDEYKPRKRESYFNERSDHRSYGRTSIPFVGNKAVYEKV